MIGTLNIITSGTGGVIFRETSVYAVDIGALGASDLLAIAGGYIDLTGSDDQLDLNGLAGAFDGSAYTIATFDQNLGSGTFDTVTGLPSDYVIAYHANDIMLLPVPEPGALALASEVLILVAFTRARFRKFFGKCVR